MSAGRYAKSRRVHFDAEDGSTVCGVRASAFTSFASAGDVGVFCKRCYVEITKALRASLEHVAVCPALSQKGKALALKDGIRPPVESAECESCLGVGSVLLEEDRPGTRRKCLDCRGTGEAGEGAA